jgi:LPXTG-motif cell wall-anchored protein
MMTTRAVRVLAVTFVTAVSAIAGIATAAPATAADSPQIQVSTNGTTFSSEFSGSLFDDMGLIVPQDAETTSIWIRNPLTVAVQMRVSMKSIETSSSALASSMELTTVNAGDGTTVAAPLSDLATCDVVVPSTPIAAGATVRVDLTLEMLDVDEQIAQTENGEFSFLVAMRDGEAGAFPASACDDVGVVVPGTPPTEPADDGDSLAITGLDVKPDWFVLSGVLLGLGLLFLVRRRRSSREAQ